MKNKDKRKTVDGSFIAGLIIGLISGMIIGALVSTADININQEVADDVCRQLTNDSTATASDVYNGVYSEKLVCRILPAGSTHNIIIETG